MTDGGGLYKIEQLRGGVYTVTFSLSGFKHVAARRHRAERIVAATVNAELKVGSIAETVTVTGGSPWSTSRRSKQRVINQELLVAIPTGRTPQVAAFLIPGVTSATSTSAAPTHQHPRLALRSGGSNADTGC